MKFSLAKGNKPKSGFVYAISDPAFQGFYKVGMTQDITKRLANYQTYDPHRRYKVELYRFVEDRRAEEKLILERYKTDLSKGEWIALKDIKNIFPETM